MLSSEGVKKGSGKGIISQRGGARILENHNLEAPPRGQSQSLIKEHSLLPSKGDLAICSQGLLRIAVTDQ
jgi:hypothetical protein